MLNNNINDLMERSQKSGFVAIIGRPNVGKSTLLNNILQSKLSIVTPKSQTTRDQIKGIFTHPEKGQIVFLDTPGIHKARTGGLNEQMVKSAVDALDGPDVVWYMVDPASSIKHEAEVIQYLVSEKTPIFLIFNKIDIKGKDYISASITSFIDDIKKQLPKNNLKIFKISAITGRGVKTLLNNTWELIPKGELYYSDQDVLSDKPTRFFVAEFIREVIFFTLQDELPYSCSIKILEYKEDTVPIRIEAVICVERDSQLRIFIGQNGKVIKSIGMNARKKIEEFIGAKVFLGLKVEVLKNWTRNEQDLKRMGYFWGDQ